MQSKKKPVAQMLAYGLGAIALYALVFSHSDAVADYCSRGGWYSALPIGTVFLFSFVHGNFAGALWTVLGINATINKPAAPQPEARKSERARPRLRATLNA